MIIRHIEQHEIDTFVQFYKNPGYQNWINWVLKKKETRPEWCFVAEENGKHLGNAFYFQYEGYDAEMSVRGLMLPWEGNYAEIGERLLNESMEQVKTHTIKKLEFRCDTGHPYHKEMIAVGEKAGYRLFQEKYRYQLEEFDKDDDYRNQFVFKTLQEVGEERFINAIQRITVQTLDRVDENDCELLGAEEAARAYFHILKSVDYTPHRWVLAYNTDKKLVGLVVAQLLSQNTGCINSIGVIPEYRGKNYSRDLVIKAHSLLRNVKSVTEIVAEIDTKNVPLENTLAALQYKKTKTMWIHHGDL